MRLHYSSIKDDTELILLDLQQIHIKHSSLLKQIREVSSKTPASMPTPNVLLQSPSSEQTPPGIYLCNYLQACTELLLTSD